MSKEMLIKYSVAFNHEEFTRIQQNADWLGMSVSEYLRRAGLGTLPKGC